MLQSLASHPVRCGHLRLCLVLDVIQADSGSHESPLVFRCSICTKWNSLWLDPKYSQALRKTWRVLCQNQGWEGGGGMAGGTLTNRASLQHAHHQGQKPHQSSQMDRFATHRPQEERGGHAFTCRLASSSQPCLHSSYSY